MLTDVSSPLGRAVRLAEGAAALAQLPLARRVDALTRTAALLRAQAEGPALEVLVTSSGLSPAMVRWGLETTLCTVRAPVLEALGEGALGAGGPGRRAIPARLCVLILSGNLFTAPVRAMLLPLLLGVPVLAKASSRDDALPRLLRAALLAADAEVGAHCDVITLEGDSPHLGAMLAQADVVSVYGSDSTVQSVRGRAPATARVVPHGHGLGALYIDATDLRDDASLDRVARSVAEDVAAYDQRGCLSPHAAWVNGSAADAERLAERVARLGLEPLARERPRGALPGRVGGAQVQWRGVASVRGRLFEGDGYSVSVEGDGPLRMSPGYRNLSVLRCDGLDGFIAALRPLGAHLKAVGVGGDPGRVEQVRDALVPPLAARVSAAGTMQTPPFDALADGELPTAGFLRFAEAR